MNLIRTGIVLAVLLGLLLPSSFQFATDSASTPKIYSDDTDTIEDDEDLASGSGDGSGDGIDDGIGETDIRNSYSTRNAQFTRSGYNGSDGYNPNKMDEITEPLPASNQVNHGNKALYCPNSGETIPLSKACDNHFDCEDGTDEMCFSEECSELDHCLCEHTKQCILRNHSHIYLYQPKLDRTFPYLGLNFHGNPMVLHCPTDSVRNFVESNWYRNDREVPSNCRIIPPTMSNPTSQLHCSNLTLDDEGVYTCSSVNSQNVGRDFDIFVITRSEWIFKIDSCFCFEATTTCSNTNTTVTHRRAKLLSDSPPLLLTITGIRKKITLNYTIFEGKNLNTISQMKVEGMVYFVLSDEIVNMKLQLYGGFLRHQLSAVEASTSDEIYPIALIRGDGKELVYFESGNFYKNSRYRKLSFTKHNWYMLEGDNLIQQSASEADVMKVLANLQGIYLRMHSPFDYYTENSIITLDLVEFIDGGRMGTPSSIGNCDCPPEYNGTFCERCAVNFYGDPIKGIPCSVQSNFDDERATRNNNEYHTQNVPTTSEGTYDNSNEKQHRKLSDNNDSSNDSNTEEYGETATLPASDHQARHDSTSYSSKERSGTEATVGNEMIENGNTVTTQLTPTLTANSSSPTNVTSTTPSSKSSRGSSPNPARFLFRSFDCLVLYFFSLCCSMWWYRFI